MTSISARFVRIVTLCAACSLACGLESRDLIEGDAAGDADADLPTTDADEDAAETSTRQLRCALDELGPISDADSGPTTVAALIRLPVDAYVLVGLRQGREQSELATSVLRDHDMAPLQTTTFPDVDAVTAAHDPVNGGLIALIDRDAVVSFHQLLLGSNWGFELSAGRTICRSCLPAATPIAGTAWSIVGTERVSDDAFQLHNVPHRDEESMVSAPPQAGERNELVRGVFGPLVLQRRDQRLATTQFHWDVEPASPPTVVDEELVIDELAATRLPTGELLVAVATSRPDSAIVLLELDDQGRRLGLWPVVGIEGDALSIALSANDDSLLLAWLTETDSDMVELRAMVLRHRSDIAVLASTTLFSVPANESLPTLATASHRDGYAIAAADGSAASVLGYEIECWRE